MYEKVMNTLFKIRMNFQKLLELTDFNHIFVMWKQSINTYCLAIPLIFSGFPSIR